MAKPGKQSVKPTTHEVDTGYTFATNTNENRKRVECFVMMPFGSNNEYEKGCKESDFVFDYIICGGIEKFKEKSGMDVSIHREVDKNTPGSITKSIVESIAKADICIVDITGQNANVFFELGIRYSLRHKTTILLRQENTKIPFDIGAYKCLTYDCFKPRTAVATLADFIEKGLSYITAVDSLVFETFPDMQIHIPNITSEQGGFNDPPSFSRISWDEWWRRVKELSEILKATYDNGRFVPTTVFGISNGGLSVADSLGRMVFKGVPILSLWMNRWTPSRSPTSYFCDNEYNVATLQALKRAHEKEKNKITILITDDIVVSGNTITQAAALIKRELVDNYSILFTPLFTRNTDYLESFHAMLISGYEGGNLFGISKYEYYNLLRTTKSQFPYEKDL